MQQERTHRQHLTRLAVAGERILVADELKDLLLVENAQPVALGNHAQRPLLGSAIIQV